MGLFVMDQDTPQTPESCIRAAEANLRLFNEEGRRYPHLLEFASRYYAKAAELMRELEA